MADNVAITAGTGTTVAADEVVDGTLGTVKVQYIKLMDGTNDGTNKAAVNSSGELKVNAAGTVAATQSGTWDVQAQDGAGNALTSATRGSEQALSVQVVDGSGAQITAFGGAGGTASTIGDAYPATATAAGVSDGTDMVALEVGTAGTAAPTVLTVQGIAAGTEVPISGTVVATQSGTWDVQLQDGAGTALTSATRGSEQALTVQVVDGSGAQVTTFGGAGGTASNIGSAYPATATAAGVSDGTNMVALKVGTAGTAATTVLSVQGIASGTALPISGTVTVNTLPTGTNNIGDVDVLTVPTDPFGANADAASTTGSISGKLKGIATALGTTALDLGASTGGSRTLRVAIDTNQMGSLGQAAMAASVPVALATDQTDVSVVYGTLGQAAMAASIPVAFATDQTALAITGGGTSSTIGSAYPATATAAGVSDGTNMVALKVGTAGTAATTVLSVQGIASGTALPISDNSSSLTVDGTVAATQSGVWAAQSGGYQYETVTASASAQVLGATGAVGDYIEGLVCVVATAATSAVSIGDGNGSAISVLPNAVGAGVGTYYVPLGLRCIAATTPGWKVTTGAGVSVIATGIFT